MSPGFKAYMAEMATGECLCAEIAEADRPCLTCEANTFPLPPASRDEVTAFLRREAEKPPTGDAARRAEAEACEAEMGDAPW